MEREHLEVLGDDAAVAVDDRLGEARRARAVQHVQRVVDGDGREGQRLRRCPGEQLVPRVLLRGARSLRTARRVEIRDVDDVAQRRQGGDDLGDVVAPIDVLGAVAVAVDGDEHDRLDLPEAVDDRANPELRSATRPDRPERGGGEQGDECLGNVRGVGDDTIARSDTEPAQGGRAALDTEREVFPRQLDRVARLADGDDGDAVGVADSRSPGPARRSSACRRGTSARRASCRRRGSPSACVVQRTPVNSVDACQKLSMSSIDQRISASKSSKPWAVAKRPSAVVCQASSGGVHSTSPRGIVKTDLPRPRHDSALRDRRARREAVRVEQCIEVDPRVDAGVGEHHDEVLGGEIAARRRGERRAAESAERRVEAIDAERQRCPGVEQRRAAGVVEVQADVDPGGVEYLLARDAASPSPWCRRG